MSQVTQLGPAAIGTLGPIPRIDNNEITELEVDQLVDDLSSGELYDDISDTLRANAAGGTFSLPVADALTTGRFRAPGATAAQHAETMFAWLEENKNDPQSRAVIPAACIDGRPVVPGTPQIESVCGGHEDCGAQNKLGIILDYIAKNGDVLRTVTEANGVHVDDATHEMIIANATQLVADGYAGNGEDIKKATQKTSGDHSVVPVVGVHLEVAARRNTDPAKTLNRYRLQERHGDKIEAFNVDAGVFPAAAETISISEEEMLQKTVALEYFNTGAALVLGHESLQVVS